MAAPTGAKFPTQSSEGINFSLTYTAYDQTAATSTTNDPSNPGPPFAVGTQAQGTDGTIFVFVKASEAITQYACVSISTAFLVVHHTLALNRALTKYGFAQVAIASGAYGWVAISGQGIGVLARLSSQPGVPVYISNVSAGRVSTTSVRNTSGGTLIGLVLTTSSTGSPSAATVANAEVLTQSRVNG